MNNNYYQKYLKYKLKYDLLRKQIDGQIGGNQEMLRGWFFFNLDKDKRDKLYKMASTILFNNTNIAPKSADMIHVSILTIRAPSNIHDEFSKVFNNFTKDFLQKYQTVKLKKDSLEYRPKSSPKFITLDFKEDGNVLGRFRDELRFLLIKVIDQRFPNNIDEIKTNGNEQRGNLDVLDYPAIRYIDKSSGKEVLTLRQDEVNYEYHVSLNRATDLSQGSIERQKVDANIKKVNLNINPVYTFTLDQNSFSNFVGRSQTFSPLILPSTSQPAPAQAQPKKYNYFMHNIKFNNQNITNVQQLNTLISQLGLNNYNVVTSQKGLYQVFFNDQPANWLVLGQSNRFGNYSFKMEKTK